VNDGKAVNKPMTDQDCEEFLQWALPPLRLR
jgi:hypothetical protein